MSAALDEPEERPLLPSGYEARARIPRCAETNCLAPAALLLNDVGRCVPCHRARNGGRI